MNLLLNSFFPTLSVKVGLNERVVIFEALAVFGSQSLLHGYFPYTVSDFSNQHSSHENDVNHSLSYLFNHEERRHK